MGDDGAGLLDGLILLGLALGSGPLLHLVFGLPADPADQGALLTGAVGLVIATSVLPVWLAGGTILLALRHAPAWATRRGRAGFALILGAVGGAGFGILGVLTVGSGLALVGTYAGLRDPILTTILRALTFILVGAAGIAASGQGLRITARTHPPGAAAPTGRDWLIAGATPVTGIVGAAWLLVAYPLLRDPASGPILLAGTCLGIGLWQRRPHRTSAGDAAPPGTEDGTGA
jgi:hypothetical protein